DDVVRRDSVVRAAEPAEGLRGQRDEGADGSAWSCGWAGTAAARRRSARRCERVEGAGDRLPDVAGWSTAAAASIASNRIPALAAFTAKAGQRTSTPRARADM